VLQLESGDSAQLKKQLCLNARPIQDANMIDSTENAVPDKTKPGSQWKIQLGVLCGMLLLALVGMGLTQSIESGAWEFWFFVVLVYACLGLWRSTRKAKQAAKPVGNLITHQLAHWAILLVFLGIVALIERQEIMNRESASNVALMLLAVGCCLAGVHFDWLFLLVGAVLTIMLVAMATLEQYSLVMWIITVLAVIAAAAFFYFKSRNESSSLD
jgi:uncharacterized membrane protein YfcA